MEESTGPFASHRTSPCHAVPHPVSACAPGMGGGGWGNNEGDEIGGGWESPKGRLGASKKSWRGYFSVYVVIQSKNKYAIHHPDLIILGLVIFHLDF